jgi:hypothetical protein
MDHSIGTDHQTKCLRQRKTAAEIENAKPLRCGIEMMQIVWLREIALQLAALNDRAEADAKVFNEMVAKGNGLSA